MTKAQKALIFAAFDMLRDEKGKGAPVGITIAADRPDMIVYTVFISPTATSSGTMIRD